MMLKENAVLCQRKNKTYRANQWEQKASTNTGSDVTDWQDEPCGHALLVGLMRERQVSLCHAHWQIAETLREEARTKHLFDVSQRTIQACSNVMIQLQQQPTIRPDKTETKRQIDVERC